MRTCHIRPNRLKKFGGASGRQTPGIDSYFVTNSLTSSISLQKKTVKNVNITGASQGYFKAKKLEMLTGRSLQDNDYKNFSRVIVIDQMVAKNSLRRMRMP